MCKFVPDLNMYIKVTLIHVLQLVYMQKILHIQVKIQSGIFIP